MILGCLGALVAAGVAVVLIGLLLSPRLLEPYLQRRVREAARQRGFAIEFVALRPSLTKLQLEGVTLTLLGEDGIDAHLDRIDVALDRLEPVAATVHGGQLRVVGSAPALALSVAEWTRAYPDTYAIPLTAQGIGVEWREAPAAEPWLTLAAGNLLPTPVGGEFAAERALVVGVDVGRVTAGYQATEAQIALGFGAASPAAGPVQIVVRHAANPPVAIVTLRPTPLERLAGPLGVPLPISGVTASGDAELVLPPGIGSGPVTGTLRVALQGYIPPHPVELDGFVFGDVTELATKLAMSADRRQVSLTETRVTAGRFVVKGKGDVTRSPDTARVRLALRGELSCAALAGAAAQSRLGEALGRVAARLAQQTIKGSVAVRIDIDAQTHQLDQARMIRTIGVGCGLQPIAIPGIGTIDLSGLDLTDLPSGFPSGLPTALPSALPPVPSAWRLPPVPTSLPLPSLGTTSRVTGSGEAEPPP